MQGDLLQCEACRQGDRLRYVDDTRARLPVGAGGLFTFNTRAVGWAVSLCARAVGRAVTFGAWTCMSDHHMGGGCCPGSHQCGVDIHARLRVGGWKPGRLQCGGGRSGGHLRCEGGKMGDHLLGVVQGVVAIRAGVAALVAFGAGSIFTGDLQVGSWMPAHLQRVGWLRHDCQKVFRHHSSDLAVHWGDCGSLVGLDVGVYPPSLPAFCC